MIFDIVQGIITMFLPIALIMSVLLYISDLSTYANRTVCKQLKALVCMLLSFAIIISTLFISVFNIYYVATVLEELEPLPYVVRELMFTCVTFLWNIIGVVLIFNLWKHIYYTNHNIINNLKKDWKKIKERKSHGRYENTN